MSFYKYTHSFADGCDEVGWLEADPRDIDEIRHDYREKYDWSEHYRGVTFELVEHPPDWWLREKINNAQGTMQFLGRLIDRYTKLLSERTA